MLFTHLSTVTLLIAGLAIGYPIEPRTGGSGKASGPSTQGKTNAAAGSGSHQSSGATQGAASSAAGGGSGSGASQGGNTPSQAGSNSDSKPGHGKYENELDWNLGRFKDVQISASKYATTNLNCNTKYDNGKEEIKPGCTGVWYDGKIFNVMYGNAVYLHASHVSYHYNEHKEHDRAWPLADKATKDENRVVATGDLKDFHPPTKFKPHRDEKMPAALQHDRLVTVAMLPDFESNMEGQLMRTAVEICKKEHGNDRAKDCMIRLFDNRSIDKGKFDDIPKLLAKEGDVNPGTDTSAQVFKGDNAPDAKSGQGAASSGGGESGDKDKGKAKQPAQDNKDNKNDQAGQSASTGGSASNDGKSNQRTQQASEGPHSKDNKATTGTQSASGASIPSQARPQTQKQDSSQSLTHKSSGQKPKPKPLPPNKQPKTHKSA